MTQADSVVGSAELGSEANEISFHSRELAIYVETLDTIMSEAAHELKALTRQIPSQPAVHKETGLPICKLASCSVHVQALYGIGRAKLCS